MLIKTAHHDKLAGYVSGEHFLQSAITQVGTIATGVWEGTAVASITVGDESTDTECFPLFATTDAGAIAPKTGSNLTFNSVTGLLEASALTVTGNVTATGFVANDFAISKAGNIWTINAETGDGDASSLILALGAEKFLVAGIESTDGTYQGLDIGDPESNAALTLFGSVFHFTTGTIVAPSLALTANTNQIVFDSESAQTTTLRDSAAAGSRTITLPNFTGTLYITGGTDVAVADGGTNLSSYAVGDLLYASGVTTLAKLADVAAGQVLVSGGVGVAPAWSATPSVTSLTATGTVQAEQLTSTDDLTMQGHLFTLGNNTDTDIILTFDTSTKDATLTYDVSQDNFALGSSNLYLTGSIGVSTDPSTGTFGVGALLTTTDTAGYGALMGQATLSPSSAASGTYWGVQGQITTASDGNNLPELVGLEGELLLYSTTATHNITEAIGINSTVLAYSSKGGTITDLYGIKVTGTDATGWTITNAYGLYLSDFSFGDTTSWAIYSAGGNSSHAGNFRVGDNTVPTYTFEVKDVLCILERSSDPAEPAEGKTIIWMSDSTGYGDDGDVCIAAQAGGTTKKAILFDHSAGAGW